ncbi:MAG: cob(I)yrinic acid a,c-diamide adenosyltransferase [Candidatus Poribacteria bacterium]|nr:cob(I)yrinic acid a,c-diamide adenosyltransferase [Candidatus Poribacteria bacterium]
MKIYTKFGDSGETALYGGTRVGKDAPRIEAIGTVDELNAYIGYAQTLVDDTDLSDLMAQIQNHLFAVGADLATPATHTKAAEFRISANFTTAMETAIDTLSEELPPLTNFILPGGCTAGAILHIARVVCRRSERCVVRLAREEDVNPEIIRSLNRLSDLLFVLARVVNFRANTSEPIWESQSDA